jgi:hypothetical protein
VTLKNNIKLNEIRSPMTYFTLSTGFTDPEFPAASASTKFCGVHCMRLRLITVWRVYPLHNREAISLGSGEPQRGQAILQLF